MKKYYLAVDIGASSGRHILAHMEKGKLVIEEMYRFWNGMSQVDDELCWDVDQLFKQIKEGMKKCFEAGKIPVSMGIDTWAVDFVLLDEKEERIGNAVSYRDERTEGMDTFVYQIIPEKELYSRTGIQKQRFNTVYQLMALQKKHPERLKHAKKMLLIPDYFHFLLTGKTATEYTNATTTQLVSPVTKTWDLELAEKLGFPGEIFQEIKLPGTGLGTLREEIQKEVGFNCKVVIPATHDTASAVMAVPAVKGDVLYLSSGTWSLLGTELLEADCSKESRNRNFTNEGGYDYRFRYLKNIMGLWMIQLVKQEMGEGLTFSEICDMAEKQQITSLVDCNDDRFMKPENMTREIQKACEESGQQVPEGIGEIAAVVYHSLAKCYGKAVEELETITGKTYRKIHIVGGGANADYLNRLTAMETGKKALAGPTEATAIGNIAAQMLSDGVWENLSKARECILGSFPIKNYE